MVSVTFIILMSKNHKLSYFHAARGVLPVLASCVTRSPKRYPAFPAASPQHSCDKNTPCFGQATLGDPTACPGSCDHSTEVSLCHLGAAGDAQGPPLPSLESCFPACPSPHVLTLLSESGLLPQPVCVPSFRTLWSPAAGGGREPGDTARMRGGRGVPTSLLLFPFPFLGHRDCFHGVEVAGGDSECFVPWRR